MAARLRTRWARAASQGQPIELQPELLRFGSWVGADMDGNPAVSGAVYPDRSFTYTFTARDAGLFWYHPHVEPDEQMELGLHGPLLVRGREEPAVASERVLVFDDVDERLRPLDERAKRAGLNIRILELTIKGPHAGSTRELVYQLERASNGVSEILALSNHELLVLERDGEFGREAVWRRLYTVDISKASDVSAIESLPREDLPNEIAPVAKTKFLDFCDERFGLVGKNMPEKIEGLALGPVLPDDRRTLIVTIDNDLREDVDNIIWVFALKP